MKDFGTEKKRLSKGRLRAGIYSVVKELPHNSVTLGTGGFGW